MGDYVEVEKKIYTIRTGQYSTKIVDQDRDNKNKRSTQQLDHGIKHHRIP